MKKAVLVILVIATIGVGLFWWLGRPSEVIPPPPAPTKLADAKMARQTIGLSVEKRLIESYTYGRGSTHLLFVGGIHGGYEWNSVLLAYKLIDYLAANPQAVPESLQVTVIPSANPDGVYKVIGKTGRFAVSDVPTADGATVAGRFNAHTVDLNRNFDCKWQATSTWRGAPVSGGTKPFSEPEANVLRNFLVNQKPAGVIFWHSQANAVFASECNAGILPATLEMMNIYAQASGYPAIKSFDQYKVTGAAEDWLASIDIPAITVELATHETIEWDKNLAGVKALFTYYATK